MHVGIVGGGLQGCCAALALAERGVRVTLFDKNPSLLSRAAVANEGKIHLGYMYAGDPTLSTARMMMTGALAFAPFLERCLGRPAHSFAVSAPAAYGLHRESQATAEKVGLHLAAVHALVNEAAASRKRAYFGMDLSAPLRPWSAAEREAEFDPEIATGAVSTPEIAINPTALAKTMREAVGASPLIESRCASEVVGLQDAPNGVRILSKQESASACERFDHVVNAAWDGRLALDATLGFGAGRPFMHRLKYGVSFRLPADAVNPPSVTFVLGPFGEVVAYGDGLVYLTWYPECLQAISTDLKPPEWETYPPEPSRSRIFLGTLRALAKIVHKLSGLAADSLNEVTVKGGAIVAWGKTDIYDRTSELHRRFEIGVTSQGRFHSIDPGKLTMAPYFAQVCAERIRSCARAGF